MRKSIYAVLMFVIILCNGCNHYSEENNQVSSSMNEDSINIMEKSETDDFVFNEKNIFNMQEVTEDFVKPECTREFDVENHIENKDIPSEIIDILISENNGKSTEELYKDFLSNSYVDIQYTEDDNSDIKWILDYLGERGIIDMKQVDIDYDNESEFLVEYGEGTDGGTAISCFKKENSEMKEILYIYDKYGHYELLEVEHVYYILIGDYVVYYDSNMEKFQEINCERITIDYKIHEFYSNAELKNIALDNIDLVNKNDWERQEYNEFNMICGTPLVLECEMDGSKYYYVYTDFRNHTREDRDDRVLFVVKYQENKKYEIVKGYYLEAKLKLIIK